MTNTSAPRIASVRTLCATRMHERERQWITHTYRIVKADIAVVEVTTDDGRVGAGEACAYGNPLQIADWVAWYAPKLVGASIDDFSVVPRPTGTALEHAVGSAHDYAVAGIDCALWDLRGQHAGLPVSQVLAKDASHEVEAYASSGVTYDWRGDPSKLVEDVVGCAAAGYRTVKVRIGTAWHWDGVTPSRFLSLLDEVRKSVGEDIAIAVDANARLSFDEAVEMTYGLSERGIAWFEEPVDKHNLEAYKRLNRLTDLRISGGETFTTIEQFRPWIEQGALSIVQPDAGVCGISEVMRIGRLAAEAGIELIPHSWHNGLMIMANAHAVAALPNAPLVEECMVQGPLKWDSVHEGSQVHDGKIRFDGRPGLGVRVAEDLEERFPYVEGYFSVEVYR